MRTFALVAEHGSFVAAAHALRMSPTKASRVVADLEASLQTVLLHRTTRSVTLTDAGAHYLERCRHALEELDAAERALRGEDAEPRGLLVVTAPVLFGRMLVRPVVNELLARNPALRVRLLLLDRVVRLAEEGVDVAVRIADLSDSSLRAVRLRETRRVLVASPAYLARHGTPATIAQLQDHALISFDGFAPYDEWRFAGPGRPSVRLDARFGTNEMEAAIEAALDGLGITRAFCYQVEAHVAAGRLVRLLDDVAPAPVPVSLVYQPHRQRSAALRAFVELARTTLRG